MEPNTDTAFRILRKTIASYEDRISNPGLRIDPPVEFRMLRRFVTELHGGIKDLNKRMRLSDLARELLRFEYHPRAIRDTAHQLALGGDPTLRTELAAWGDILVNAMLDVRIDVDEGRFG